MIQLTMTEAEFLAFLAGGDWYLGGFEPGFDWWEQTTGRTQILINGDTAEVFVEYLNAACGCCDGDRSAGSWWVTLTNA